MMHGKEKNRAIYHKLGLNERFHLDHLNYLDAYVYFSDAKTKEVFYCNEALKNLCGIEDYTEKKCWEAIYHKEEQCEFCPLNDLEQMGSDTVVWTLYDTTKKRYYWNYNVLVPREDGRNVHMHCSFDMTESDNARMETQKRTYALYNIVMNFVVNKNFSDSIQNALQIFGQYMNVDHIRIFKEVSENNSFDAIYNWNKQTGTAEEQSIVLNADVFYALQNGESVVVENSFDNAEKKLICNRIGSFCYVCAPIKTREGLWGFLQMDTMDEHRKWTAEEINTIRTVTDIFASGIERCATEEQLYTAQSTLRVMLDNVPSSIYWKDRNSIYKGCNKAFSHYFGIPEKKLIGKTDFELFADSKPIRDALATDKNVILNKVSQPKNVEWIDVRKTGKKHCLSISNVPVLNETGDVTHVLGIVEDITKEAESREQMKQRDLELKRAIIAEQQANQAKSEFISRMSHEMRTPLNAILGMTNIANNTKDLKKIKYCLEKIKLSSDYLLASINDVLDLAKMESDKMILDNEDFCLEKLLVNICNVIAVQMNQKRQKLSVRISPDVPGNFVGDCHRLGQVMMNVLSNAVKFTPDHGTIAVDVSIAGRQKDEMTLKIAVKDNGIGMNKEAMAKLFVPFEQADISITRKFGGSGLGMSIVKKIVDCMGGKINVKSAPGRGTEIIFTVKMQVSIHDDRPKLMPSLQFQPLNIVIFDPSMKSATEFNRATNKNTRVILVKDRRGLYDALYELHMEEKACDVIFIDYNQLRLEGADLVKYTNQKFGKQKFALLLSSHQLNQSDSILSMEGIEKLLSYPLFPSALIKTINELCGDKQNDETMLEPDEDLSDKTVLLVEDIHINAEIMEEFLHRRGAKTVTACNGQIAVNQFKKNQKLYDLILMDLHMPVMNGYEAAKEIRKLDAHIPMIAMTADVMKEDFKRCIEAGMNDYLVKPIDPILAMKKIKEYINLAETLKKKQYKKASRQKTSDDEWINYEQGLQRMEGNVQIFRKLLYDFSNSKEVQALQDAWKRRDKEQLEFLVHSIKGIAGSLSLNKLYQESIEYQEKLKGQQLKNQDFNRWMSWFQKTIKVVKKLLDEAGEDCYEEKKATDFVDR